jgi:hypothetical protein
MHISWINLSFATCQYDFRYMIYLISYKSFHFSSICQLVWLFRSFASLQVGISSENKMENTLVFITMV